MSSANKTTKKPTKVEEKIERAARRNVSSFAYFTAPVLRNDCENRSDGLEGRWRRWQRLAFHFLGRRGLLYLSGTPLCVCALAACRFLISFNLSSFFVRRVCFTWREINLKFKCARSKLGGLSLMMMMTALAGTCVSPRQGVTNAVPTILATICGSPGKIPSPPLPNKYKWKC